MLHCALPATSHRTIAVSSRISSPPSSAAGQTREAEQKRINKELANIRAKFKDIAKLDGYQRRK